MTKKKSIYLLLMCYDADDRKWIEKATFDHNPTDEELLWEVKDQEPDYTVVQITREFRLKNALEAIGISRKK